ncbi:MAG: hypothetical protein R2755_23475 [Acidimicrobiales bacterium]
MLVAAVLVREPVAQRRSVGTETFEVRNSGLGFAAFGTNETDGELVDADGAVVEEALVAVADLFDVEGLVGDPSGDLGAARLHMHGEQGVEDCEDGAVVDGDGASRSRFGLRVGAEADAPSDDVVGSTAAFEEGEAVGVEEAAAIGGKGEPVVVDAAVNGSEGGEEAMPGGGASLEGVKAVTGRGLAKIVAERQDAVGLSPQGVFGGKEPAFFGEEEEHEPHEDRDGGFVDVCPGDASEDPSPGGDVVSGDGGDEQLDRPAHRGAEPLVSSASAFAARSKRRSRVSPVSGSSATAKNRRAPSKETRAAWRMVSSARSASVQRPDAAGAPRGAQTSAQASSLVTSASGVPDSRHQVSARWMGLAGHVSPLLLGRVRRSSGVPVGQMNTPRRILVLSSASSSAWLGRRVIPRSAVRTAAVVGMRWPSARRSSQSRTVPRSQRRSSARAAASLPVERSATRARSSVRRLRWTGSNPWGKAAFSSEAVRRRRRGRPR